MAEDNTADFLELLPQLKTLVSTPSTITHARGIITSVPHMCYALVKIMADMGLLDMDVTTRILAGGNASAANQPSLALASSIHNTPPTLAGPSTTYSTPPASRNSGYIAQAPLMGPGAILYAPTNVDIKPTRPISTPSAYLGPTATPPVAAPPVPTPADPTAAILAALPPEQRDAVLAIIAMTPEQLQVMPPEQRAQFIELRRKFLGSG